VLAWLQAVGAYDRWATMHTLRDSATYTAAPNDNGQGTGNIHDYFGVIRNDGTSKTVTTPLAARWAIDDAVTTPPVEPDDTPVIDGTPLEVSTSSWGYRMGFTVPWPPPAGAPDAVRALGCKQIRTIFTEGQSTDALSAFIEEAKRAGVHVTVAIKASGESYHDWSTGRMLYFMGTVKAVAAMGPRVIELGPGLNDPNQTNDVSETDGGTLWQLAALIFAKNALAVSYPNVEIYGGSYATVGVGTPPHEAIEILARDWNPELSTVVDGFSIDGDGSTTVPSVDVSALPYGSPIWHLRDVQDALTANGVLRPVSITSIGFTGTLAELAFTFAVTMSGIEELIRSRGLRIGRLFWNGLYDTSETEHSAPYTPAGVAQGTIVNPIVARAELAFPTT
jgi:hypothetical protein